MYVWTVFRSYLFDFIGLQVLLGLEAFGYLGLEFVGMVGGNNANHVLCFNHGTADSEHNCLRLIND